MPAMYVSSIRPTAPPIRYHFFDGSGRPAVAGSGDNATMGAAGGDVVAGRMGCRDAPDAAAPAAVRSAVSDGMMVERCDDDGSGRTTARWMPEVERDSGRPTAVRTAIRNSATEA